MFLDIGLGNSFLDWPQKHSNKNKSKQVGPQQNNKFCTAKKKKETKGNWQMILASHIFDKALISPK